MLSYHGLYKKSCVESLHKLKLIMFAHLSMAYCIADIMSVSFAYHQVLNTASGIIFTFGEIQAIRCQLFVVAHITHAMVVPWLVIGASFVLFFSKFHQ
jgi:hypothetical protein